MRTARRFIVTLVITTVVGGMAVGACVAALVPGVVGLVNAHRYTVKEVGRLRHLSERSTIYWADGSPMGTLGVRDRELVSLDEVPVRVQDAIIATEDRTFWTNDGIDLGAVVRALATNVVSGEVEQGGSTITQQLVKQRILSSKRDVTRKIREIETALRLTDELPKRRILEEYLNTVYFGQGSYGIKAAARRFFVTTDPGAPYPRGKRLDELTIGEAALLAGVISSPEANNPFTHPDQAVRRRAASLRAQVELGYITQHDADAANLEPLPTVEPPAEQRPDNFLVAEVQDRLLADPALGATPAARRNKLLKGGLDVYTTFDPRLQSLAEQATAFAKPVRLDFNWVSSLVSIDYRSGAVRAMVGGPSFTGNEYNIATHYPGRQPGSTWKIITLVTALANGYSANDTVDGSSPCSVESQFPGLPPDTWPRNNEGDGGRSTTIRTATTGSVNCSFVRLSTSVGQDNVIAMANRIGITQPLQRVLNLSIGTIEATPLEMATVIGTVADNGVHHTPYMVAKVVDDDDVLIDNTTPAPGERAFGDDVAACAQSLLRQVVDEGTGTRAKIDGYSVFGKTGTTDLRADAWFVGSAANLATAVWFGNQAGNVPGAGFGGDSAAPIFRAYMQPAIAGQPDRFIPPEGPPCTAPGGEVNPDGGRSAPLFDPGALPALPSPPPAASAPAAPAPPPPAPPPAPPPSPPKPGAGTPHTPPGQGRGNAGRPSR
jgi:penicillin-binding protein 1A